MSAAKPSKHRWLIPVTVVWLAAPFVLILALTLVAQQQSVYGASKPTWIAAGDAGTSSARQVELKLTWGQPATVYAPSWSGVVGRVQVSPGSVLKSGDQVALVDGEERIAWHSSTPFYRELAYGDDGNDVAALNALLKSLSLPNTPGNFFTLSTQRGVSALAVKLGGGNGIRTFDPGAIIFLSADKIKLSKVNLSVGAPVPAPGEPVLVGQPPLLRADLDAVSSDDQASALPTVARGDEVLTIGKSPIKLATGRTGVDKAQLSMIANEVSGGQKTVAGLLTRSLPKGSVQIPAASVHTDRDGRTCVAVLKHGTESTVGVEVVGGVAGQTVVTGGIDEGDLIGVGALETNAKCAS